MIEIDHGLVGVDDFAVEVFDEDEGLVLFKKVAECLDVLDVFGPIGLVIVRHDVRIIQKKWAILQHLCMVFRVFC